MLLTCPHSDIFTTCSIWLFDSLNSSSPYFRLWWFTGVYFLLVREMENINSSLILRMWTTGTVIYGCKRKKLGLYLFKVMAALHLDCHRCNTKPKRRSFVRKHCGRFPLVLLVIQSKTWEKNCPHQIKNCSRRGCILSWFNPTHLITMLDQYPLKNAKPNNHCTHTLLRCADWFSSLPMTISWIFLG